LTAKVTAAVVGGVIVTPSGTVTFTSSDGTTTSPVGTATLGSCLLSACTATLTTSAMPPGTTSVTGRYSGDSFVAPSSGSTAVSITSPTVNGSSSTVTCDAGRFCDAGIITSSNGNGTMDTLASPSSQSQTVSERLDIGKTLHCPQNTDNQVGPLGTFTTTANDVTKTITYTGNGNVARSMAVNFAAHPAYFGCYGSTAPFQGYVYGVYTQASFVSSDGLYEAQPANCALNGNVKPCGTESQTAKTTTYKLFTDTVSDPKYIG
jgi:Bacterial Ig-like domain (group 3)